jgi:hypothetical protein
MKTNYSARIAKLSKIAEGNFWKIKLTLATPQFPLRALQLPCKGDQGYTMLIQTCIERLPPVRISC